MTRKNQDIILLKSSYREYSYGVGSYLNNLALGLSDLSNVNIYILDLSKRSESLKIQKKGNVIDINLPFVLNNQVYNKPVSFLKETAALIVNILEENIEIYKPLIISNCCNEIFISEELKSKFKGTTAFILHTASLQMYIPDNMDLNSFLSIYDNLVFPSFYCFNFFKQHTNLEINNCKIIHNGLYCSNSLNPIHEEEVNKIYKRYCIKNNEKIILYIGLSASP